MHRLNDYYEETIAEHFLPALNSDYKPLNLTPPAQGGHFLELLPCRPLNKP